MNKTKACTTVIAILIFLVLAPNLVQSVKASSNTLWSETWHSGIYEDYPGYPQNISTTKIVYSESGYFWVKIGLVVSVYQYEPWYEYDAVFFRVVLYFDSFASEELGTPLPVTAQHVSFIINKDSIGSNLNDQCISVVETATPPGFSQGRGLDQYVLTESFNSNRLWWALGALGHATSLFFEPIGAAETLIYGGRSYEPEGGLDFDNAGWGETQSCVVWWHNPGYDFGEENPVRQYAFNSIRWVQHDDVNPDAYYGIKVRAAIQLPASNPFDVGIIETSSVYLRIYHKGGGCPYICTWNGTDHVLDNNILPQSETNNGADVEDFYRLEQHMNPWYSGNYFSIYSLMLSEFENEHSYMDKVKLIAVDHDPNVNVALMPEGQILTYANPNSPVSAVDNYGYDWLPALLETDNTYYRGFPSDYLVLDFGSLDVSQAAKLVLRANLEWKKVECIHVQTLNQTGEWTDASVLRTRNTWSTIIVDLGDYLPNPDGTLKIRLYFTGIHKIDYVSLDTTLQAEITKTITNAVRAIHSTQGDVTLKLLFNDEKYAELLPGEQIELKFILRNTEKTRTFIIYIEGHYETIS